MARKLPWAAGNVDSGSNIARETTEAAPSSRRTAPRQRLQTAPKTPSEGHRSRSRSRSTSPPQGPPSVEPMREGFDADDIWMMVEDEFDSLARKFTAHLHQAEYKRRVKIAQEAPAKPLPVPASPMTKGTKRRLEQDLLRSKQSQSIEDIGVGRKTGVSEDHVDDPWRGTSLAGLITSGSQDKVSLKGLDRLPSSTRAAQGFSRARDEKNDASDDDHQKNLMRRRAERDSSDEVLSAPTASRSIVHKQQALSSRSPTPPVRDPTRRVELGNGRPVPSPQTPALNRMSTESRRIPNITTGVNVVSNSGRSDTKSPMPKRKKIKQEPSMDDRVAEMPMFL